MQQADKEPPVREVEEISGPRPDLKANQGRRYAPLDELTPDVIGD